MCLWGFGVGVKMLKLKNLDEKDVELMYLLNDDGVVIEMESLRLVWGSKF